jgi:hypothetical protein
MRRLLTSFRSTAPEPLALPLAFAPTPAPDGFTAPPAEPTAPVAPFNVPPTVFVRPPAALGRTADGARGAAYRAGRVAHGACRAADHTTDRVAQPTCRVAGTAIG